MQLIFQYFLGNKSDLNTLRNLTLLSIKENLRIWANKVSQMPVVQQINVDY